MDHFYITLLDYLTLGLNAALLTALIVLGNMIWQAVRIYWDTDPDTSIMLTDTTAPAPNLITRRPRVARKLQETKKTTIFPALASEDTVMFREKMTQVHNTMPKTLTRLGLWVTLVIALLLALNIAHIYDI